MEARRNHSEVLEAFLKPVEPAEAVNAFRQLCRRLYETEATTRKAGLPSFLPRKPPPGGGEVVSGQFVVWDCLQISAPVVFRFVPEADVRADLDAGGPDFRPLAPPVKSRIATLTLALGEAGRVERDVLSSGAQSLIVSLQACFGLGWDKPPAKRWFLDVSPRDFVWALVDAVKFRREDPAEIPSRTLSSLMGNYAGKGFPFRYSRGAGRE